ncbi:hypothetical protein ACROYT_G010243 [Oculina patagonica]
MYQALLRIAKKVNSSSGFVVQNPPSWRRGFSQELRDYRLKSPRKNCRRKLENGSNSSQKDTARRENLDLWRHKKRTCLQST